jgi:uncharacterized protein
MIIDAHCHVWPDHIAARVIATRPAGMDARHDGTIDGLRRTMDATGIDMAMCLGVANIAAHVERTNEFIGGIDRGRFIPFGTVHPGLSIERNLQSLRSNGIRGVKLHPLFQTLSLGDPRVVELLAALAEHSVVVITHAGAGGDQEANERAAPRHLRAVIDALPGLTLIACHFGGYRRIDEAQELIVGTSAFLETSWPPRLSAFDPERLKQIIALHGADRIVYGSDWPMTDPAAEIAALRALDLPPETERAILGENLAKILDLS